METLTAERLEFLAQVAGLSPLESPEWTWGELVAYVRAYRERLRDKSKELARIAYGHAMVIGSLFSKKAEIPRLWEAFPCWTDEEADEMEDALIIQQLKRDLANMRPVREEG